VWALFSVKYRRAPDGPVRLLESGSPA